MAGLGTRVLPLLCGYPESEPAVHVSTVSGEGTVSIVHLLERTTGNVPDRCLWETKVILSVMNSTTAWSTIVAFPAFCSRGIFFSPNLPAALSNYHVPTYTS